MIRLMNNETDNKRRYTSDRAGEALGLKSFAARAVLLAQAVPFIKIGNSYLWDADAVDQIAKSLPGLQKENGNE